jgi:hypothetical protein
VEGQLRAVDGDGQQQGNRADRAPSRARTSRALPTDRLKFGMQVRALEVYGRDGATGNAVNSETVGTRLGIAATTAGLNNAFFVEAGFIVKAGKGLYKPVPDTIAFARNFSFRQPDAAHALAGPLSRSWYFVEVCKQAEYGPQSRQQMIQVLGAAAGAGADREPQLSHILDWLQYAGLIDNDGGTITVTAKGASLHKINAQTGVTPPADPEGATATTGQGDADPPAGENPPPPPPPQEERPVLSAAHSLSITPSELEKLSPEQIKALFEGFAQIAAIKGALQT